MCGIFGFNRTTERTRMMVPILALAMEGRGRDSWGVTDGLILHKHVGPIGQTFEDHNLNNPTFHTRGASVGKVSERNAHPFEYISPTKEKVVVGVHNGHISNHWELKRKYEENRKDFEVDSENIFAHLAEDLPLKEIDGWGAVVWYEYNINHPEEMRHYISCFSNPSMYIAKLKTGEVVFCSEDKAIKLAARMAGAEIDFFYDVKQNWKYELKEDQLYDIGEMKWGGEPVKWEYKSTPNTHSHTGFHHQQRYEPNSVTHPNRRDNQGGTFAESKSDATIGEVCLMRGCFRHTTHGGIVCEPCLRVATLEICGQDMTVGCL